MISGVLTWSGVVALLALGITFALGPTKEAGAGLVVFLLFVAFFFLLLGLRLMISSAADEGLFLGDLLASLAMTFFWVTRQRQS